MFRFYFNDNTNFKTTVISDTYIIFYLLVPYKSFLNFEIDIDDNIINNVYGKNYFYPHVDMFSEKFNQKKTVRIESRYSSCFSNGSMTPYGSINMQRTWFLHVVWKSNMLNSKYSLQTFYRALSKLSSLPWSMTVLFDCKM